MLLKAEHKVPGGKLIKVTVSSKNNIIEEIKITGDFFLHPEESIEELEKKFKGVETNGDTIKRILHEFFDPSKILIGATPEDFFLTIEKALSKV